MLNLVGDSWVSISPALPLPWRQVFLLQWLKMSQACFQSALEFDITIQRSLIQLNRQTKVFRYLNTHLTFHMRVPKFKE